jgi:hypothetical protein
VALLPWWAYGKLLGKGSISKLVLKIFDKSVWFWRRLDVLMPWPGLSLVAVGRKAASADAPAGSTMHRKAVANRGQTANFRQTAPEIHVSPQFAAMRNAG